MATNETNKGGKKGGKGAPLSVQIDRIKAKMTPDMIAEAQALATNKRLEVRLAFKLLKVDRGGLTARQHGTYKELAAKNQQLADEWKKDRLTENAAKKAAKVSKGKAVKA
jgi:hypothetical protein